MQSDIFAISIMLIFFHIGTIRGFTIARQKQHLIPQRQAIISSRWCTRFCCSRGSSTSLDDRQHGDPRTQRLEALHEQLRDLGINVDQFEQAALQSIQDPMSGYDGRYGKSAIRTYRAFVDPKHRNDLSETKTQAAAARCALQIDFLMKRHKSHAADWVRHHDTATAECKTFPLILLLDNVRSAFNVGSLFRTADACGCREVITTGITPHPNGSGADKLGKSAVGADRIVPSRHFRTTLDAIRTLRGEKANWKLIGMETTERSVLYTEREYPNERSDSGTVLVLGNEVTGVDTDIMPLLDHVVEIPMFGAKNSLNIVACAPVVLYEILRQWNYNNSDST